MATSGVGWSRPQGAPKCPGKHQNVGKDQKGLERRNAGCSAGKDQATVAVGAPVSAGPCGVGDAQAPLGAGGSLFWGAPRCAGVQIQPCRGDASPGPSFPSEIQTSFGKRHAGHCNPAGEFLLLPPPSPRHPHCQRAGQAGLGSTCCLRFTLGASHGVGAQPGSGAAAGDGAGSNACLPLGRGVWPGGLEWAASPRHPLPSPPGRRDGPASDDGSRGYFYNRAGKFLPCFFFFFPPLLFPSLQIKKAPRRG